MPPVHPAQVIIKKRFVCCHPTGIKKIIPPKRPYIFGGRLHFECPTCPTVAHFIQDKLEISIYLSWDKIK